MTCEASWKALAAGLGLLLLPLVGCHNGGAAERFGKVYYLDGAGNWGWGTKGVVQGLKAAGYPGDVEPFTWTTSLVPVIDQALPLGARIRAAGLAGKIRRYREAYPDSTVNLVGLSAGAGVALWAVERLPDNVKVHNLVLLGASISHDYDVTEALGHMTGRIYVYHSPYDGFLVGVPILGTIDGKRGVDPAGKVGLSPPRGKEDRVVNICWSPDWTPLGWEGGHLDQASAQFVENQISRHVLEPGTALASNQIRTPLSQAQPRSFAEAALSPRTNAGTGRGTTH